MNLIQYMLQRRSVSYIVDPADHMAEEQVGSVAFHGTFDVQAVDYQIERQTLSVLRVGAPIAGIHGHHSQSNGF